MALSPGISSRIVSKPSSMTSSHSTLTPSGIRLFRKRGRGSLVRNQAFVWSKGELERLHSLSFRPRHSLVPDVVDIIVASKPLTSKAKQCTLKRRPTPTCSAVDDDSDAYESSDYESTTEPMSDVRESYSVCANSSNDSRNCGRCCCQFCVTNPVCLPSHCQPAILSTQSHVRVDPGPPLERLNSLSSDEQMTTDSSRCLHPRQGICAPERPPSPSAPPRAVVSRLTTSMVDLSIETA